MSIQSIIAAEQARVRDAARAVIAQREADIASYRPHAPAALPPVLPPGLPPGVTHADSFPPLPPSYETNEVPVGGTLMPSPGSAGSQMFLLPPIPLGEEFDDWFNIEYQKFRADASDQSSNASEPREGSRENDGEPREKKRRKKANPKGKGKAKPKGKGKGKGKAKPKAKSGKPKAKAKRKSPKKKKRVPGADSY